MSRRYSTEVKNDSEGRSRRNLIARLAAELPPVDPILERSPPRSYGVPVVLTPRGSIKRTGQGEQSPKGSLRRVAPNLPIFERLEEIAEELDLTDEEAEEILSKDPRHITRWLKPSVMRVSATPGSTASVEVASEVEPRPSTSGVTSTLVPRALVDYGSDLDSEYEFDGTITGIVSSEREIPVNDDLDNEYINIVNDVEKGMDDALDDLPIANDYDWTEDYESFRGVPEVFSGPTPGPIRDYDSPYDAFTDIWDKNIIEHIVLETNRHAMQTIESLGVLKQNSCLRRWVETDADEILVLFAVFMFMGIGSRGSLHEYWSGGILGMPKFKSMMTYSRYILMNKFLHFAPNDGTFSADPGISHKLYKISPIIQHLRSKFKNLYNLSRNIYIDESLTLFKGRLSWIQAIRSKAARFGMKSYELCESSTGYMSEFQIYTGKSDSIANTYVNVGADLGRKTTKVVLDLLQDLHHRGHCVTMDNFYNCPALARYLKKQGFDCFGTLRVSRRNVPIDIMKVPKNVAKGTVVARHSGDVSIVAWKDTKVVTIISTYHNAETYIGSKAGKVLVKPTCVRDYNNIMGGVDLKDQKLSMYLLERKRGSKWCEKLFKRLLNVSIHNSFVMYVRSLERRKMPTVTYREFRCQLANSLVERHTCRQPEVVEAAPTSTRLRRDILHPPKLVKDNNARRRCHVCYAKDKKQKKVSSFCSACDVFLCFEGDCWVTWHSSTEFSEKQETRGRKRKHYE